LIHLNTDKTRRSESGFTLIEVLVVIGIMAIVLSSIYGIFAAVSQTKDRLDNDSESYHRARVVFERLGRELHSAYYRTDHDECLFVGTITDEDLFTLEFSTSAVSPLSIEGTAFVVIKYVLEEDLEAEDGGFVLLRTESPLLSSEREDSDSLALRFVSGIKSMSLRYYGSGEWQSSWDAAADGLPERVEVEFHVNDSQGRDVPFLTTFTLP
jgi:general secretion pathway protein J